MEECTFDPAIAPDDGEVEEEEEHEEAGAAALPAEERKLSRQKTGRARRARAAKKRKAAATQVQSVVRGHQGRKAAAQREKAATKLAAARRGQLVRRSTSKRRIDAKGAAVTAGDGGPVLSSGRADRIKGEEEERVIQTDNLAFGSKEVRFKEASDHEGGEYAGGQSEWGGEGGGGGGFGSGRRSGGGEESDSRGGEWGGGDFGGGGGAGAWGSALSEQELAARIQAVRRGQLSRRQQAEGMPSSTGAGESIHPVGRATTDTSSSSHAGNEATPLQPSTHPPPRPAGGIEVGLHPRTPRPSVESPKLQRPSTAPQQRSFVQQQLLAPTGVDGYLTASNVSTRSGGSASIATRRARTEAKLARARHVAVDWSLPAAELHQQLDSWEGSREGRPWEDLWEPWERGGRSASEINLPSSIPAQRTAAPWLAPPWAASTSSGSSSPRRASPPLTRIPSPVPHASWSHSAAGARSPPPGPPPSRYPPALFSTHTGSRPAFASMHHTAVSYQLTYHRSSSTASSLTKTSSWRHPPGANRLSEQRPCSSQEHAQPAAAVRLANLVDSSRAAGTTSDSPLLSAVRNLHTAVERIDSTLIRSSSTSRLKSRRAATSQRLHRFAAPPSRAAVELLRGKTLRPL